MYIEHNIQSILWSMDLSFKAYLKATEELEPKLVVFHDAVTTRNFSVVEAAGDDYSKVVQLVEATKISFILTCAALVEAMVNTLFTLKLSDEELKEVDKNDPVSKWVEIVPELVPGFEIQRGEALYESLRTLFVDRNRITHMKPSASNFEHGTVIHPGQLPKHSKGRHAVVHRRMKAWHRLPTDLLDQLKKSDQGLGDTLGLLCLNINPYT